MPFSPLTVDDKRLVAFVSAACGVALVFIAAVLWYAGNVAFATSASAASDAPSSSHLGRGRRCWRQRYLPWTDRHDYDDDASATGSDSDATADETVV